MSRKVLGDGKAPRESSLPVYPLAPAVGGEAGSGCGAGCSSDFCHLLAHGSFFPSTRPRQALEISSQCPFRKLPTHLLCDRVSSVLADRPWPLFQSSAFPLSCTPPQVRVRTAVRIWTVVPVPVAMWSVGTTNDKEKSILHHIAEWMGTHMNSRHSVWKYLYFQQSARRCLALTTNSWVREELKSSYNGRNINSERQSLAYSQMVRNSDLNL